MRVRIRPSALADLSDGHAFYEQPQTGIGAVFLESLLADIDSLAPCGGIHRQVHGARRLLAKKFPFAVCYDVVGGVVDVKAVLDCRRDPKWITTKLRAPR